MLRGIACRLTQEGLKDILDGLGLRGKFSSIYMPRIAAHASNLGYAFVRFRHAEFARECYRLCNGRTIGSAGHGKLCEIEVAKCQWDCPAVVGSRRHRRGKGGPDVLLCDDPVELQVIRSAETNALVVHEEVFGPFGDAAGGPSTHELPAPELQQQRQAPSTGLSAGSARRVLRLCQGDGPTPAHLASTQSQSTSPPLSEDDGLAPPSSGDLGAMFCAQIRVIRTADIFEDPT